jgi:hypothetical protein
VNFLTIRETGGVGSWGVWFSCGPVCQPEVKLTIPSLGVGRRYVARIGLKTPRTRDENRWVPAAREVPLNFDMVGLSVSF